MADFAAAASASTVCERVGELCLPCDADDRDQSYCSTNGFKLEVRCSLVGGHGGGPSNATRYITYQSCPVIPGDFFGVCKFEFCMAVIFALSFSFLMKRKRKLVALQQYRISTYM